MSFINLKKIGDAQKKPAIVDVRSGDTVRVTQKIKEGVRDRPPRLSSPQKSFLLARTFW